MKKQIRKLYDWTLRIAAHKHAVWGLAAVSFAEASFFPIPPDVILIPMCIARRKKAFFYATLCTISTVAGGLLGYAIGYYLYETVGHRIIELYGVTDRFDELKIKYDEWGGWILFIKGMTPVPYKILTILSGVMHLALPVFIFASIAGRALRFFLVAWLVWKFGEPIKTFIEKYLTWVAFGALILLVGGFAAIKYVL